MWLKYLFGGRFYVRRHWTRGIDKSLGGVPLRKKAGSPPPSEHQHLRIPRLAGQDDATISTGQMQVVARPCDRSPCVLRKFVWPYH